MAAKKGLGANAAGVLARRSVGNDHQAKKTSSTASSTIVTALQAGRQAAGVAALAVDAIAPHPENPRTQLRKLDELAASITAVGILQPVMVVPADAFARERPDLVEQIGTAAFVLIAGHRRLAATQQAGLGEIPAIVSPNMANAATAAKAFAHENLSRDDLNALEEAQAFQTLGDHGQSQRKIASELGVSQAHVSKRLSLLSLPQAAQDALLTAAITIGDALELAAAPSQDQERALELFGQASWRQMNESIRTVGREREAGEQVRAAEAQIHEEGIEVIDPDTEFGQRKWKQQVRSKQDIATARKAGTLVASPTAHGPDYYTTDTNDDEATSKKVSDEAEARKANKQRAAACERLVQNRPSKPVAVAAITHSILNSGVDYLSRKLAHKWLTGPETSSDDCYTWIANLPENDQTWAAWAMTIAHTEGWTKSPYIAWGAGQVEHLDRLISQVGYEPTAWETQKLAKARSVKPNDSDGIIPSQQEES